MKRKIHISPWMTIGTSLVLMAVVGFLGVVNYNRDKEQMGILLQDKGAALIRSFEAGTRSGMMWPMGMMRRPVEGFASESHLQILLQETAGQPDISYISIVDWSGTILAHNEKMLIGRKFVDPDILKQLSPSKEPQWRIVGQGKNDKYFEVYKTFLPILESHGHPHGKMGFTNSDNKILDSRARPYIFIGMNIRPFETAMEEDFKHNLVMAAIILSLGIAGVISLFWAQNYTRSRKLLQETQKMASEVVTHLPEGILVMDTRYRVIYSNNLAWRLLGKSGKNADAKIFLPENIWSLYDEVKSGKSIAEKEICLQPNKKSVPVLVSATDIHGETGDYIGFMFVFKDLTEIRELEIKNQRIEKLATVGNLAAGVAHEVRNPLSSIKGYVTYFGSMFEKGSENRKAAELMSEEVDRVNRVISELLEFARPSDLRLKTITIRDLVDHSLRVIAHEAETGGVTIIKKIPSDLPELEADLDRLTQVLMNLYLNALQAMPRGGKLEVSSFQKQNNVMIEIKDTGAGISPDNIGHIFDPYFTTKNKGTGLGLAIANKIIENHRGSIEVKSTQGTGTLMSIILPVRMEKGED